MTSNKPNRKKITKTLFISLFLLVILLLVFSKTFEFRRKYVLKYKETSNLDYNVYLKENNYYESRYLPKNKKYISSLIDNIETKFHYNFTSERNIDMQYDYYIDATLEVDDTEGESLYQKQYSLLGRKSSKINGTNFNVDESVSINYDKYNTIAQNFIKEYGVSATAKLVVKLHVNIIGEHSEFSKKLTDNGVVKLEIPLMNSLSTVQFNYDLSNRDDALLEYSRTKVTNPVLFVVLALLILTDLGIIFYGLYLFIFEKDPVVLYRDKYTKIQKEYDRYISETIEHQSLNSLLSNKNQKVVFIKLFEDMLDIRDTIKMPILFFEEIPDHEAVFYILTDDVIYIYILSADSFKRKSKLFSDKKVKKVEEISKKNDKTEFDDNDLDVSSYINQKIEETEENDKKDKQKKNIKRKKNKK